ncbi:MAG: hypothetical protein OHK0046_08710 [Anaerolineae bacterium]
MLLLVYWPSLGSIDKHLMTTTHFSPGDKVALKSARSQRGHILEGPRQHNNTFEYRVVINNAEGWYEAKDLDPISLEPGWRKRDWFLRDMLLLKIDHAFSDNLYAYRASRTEFAPYQFRPVLKFLDNPDHRILIADEVGLGKTIEACIIYLELRARLNISQTMIVCPSRLRQKWQDELKNRFGEEFNQIDRDGFQRLLNDYERTNGTNPFRIIVGYETIRHQEIQMRMMECRFKLDLVIMDEAHYMRNNDTATHRVGALITDNADAVVFLTATPLQLGNQDLYNLLHLLAPAEYNDPQLFSDIVQPNIHINEAVRFLRAHQPEKAVIALKKVERTLLEQRFVKNPIYKSVMERLKAGHTDPKSAAELEGDLRELNTLSQIFTRTRKRDVTEGAVRAAHTIVVELTAEEREFYQAVLNSVRQELRKVNFGAISFAIVMKERMAASCLGALRQQYQHVSRPVFQRQETIRYESTFTNLFDSTDDEATSLSKALDWTPDEHLAYLAQQMGETDSKLGRLLEILNEITAEQDTKILIFSTFRDTLTYLETHLRKAGYSPGLIHGEVKIRDRHSIIEQFRTSDDFRVLLSSEVGAEGLDFQFCGVLINYDLPWNPMQVEQRIGRLDRFGQLHERIRIYNFYIEGTIETRILRRLYDRIGIFQDTLGDLEAILGEEVRELSRTVLQSHLTDEEEEDLIEKAIKRIEQNRIDGEKFELKSKQFLGQDSILSQRLDTAIKSGHVIHPDEIRATVALFLKDKFEGVEFTPDSEEPTWTLTVSPQLSAALNEHLNSTSSRKTLIVTERFREAMVHGKQIALTFDSEYARKRPLLEFITFNHLLVDLALEHYRQIQNGMPALRGLEITGPESELGTGYFFIYALDENSARKNRTLLSVIILDDGRIAEQTSSFVLGQIHERGENILIDHSEQSLDQAQAIADRWMSDQRERRRTFISDQNEALIAARVAAVRQTYKVKVARAEATREKVDDVRLKRLYDGQVRNLQAELETRIETIHQGQAFSISYNLVALGRVRIVPELELAPEVGLNHFPHTVSIDAQPIDVEPYDDEIQVPVKVLQRRENAIKHAAKSVIGAAESIIEEGLNIARKPFRNEAENVDAQEKSTESPRPKSIVDWVTSKIKRK